MDTNLPDQRPSLDVDSIAAVDRLCDRFDHLWRTAQGVPQLTEFLSGLSDLGSPVLILELVCIDLRHRWREDAHSHRWADDGVLGCRPTADDYARLLLGNSGQSTPVKWIEAEYQTRLLCGDTQCLPQLILRYPDLPHLTGRLKSVERNESHVDTLFKTKAGTFRPTSSGIRCPHCGIENVAPAKSGVADLRCTGCNSRLRIVVPETVLTAPFQSTRFQFNDKLGDGSFGVVWKAFDSQLKRMVALKLPHAAVFNSAIRERFLRESQAAAKLRHEGIVSVYDVCVTERDLPVIVSEFVDGQDLAQRLAENKMLGVRKAARLSAELADALAHAHSAGIVHRDLKPANILVDTAGKTHITDFGLAKDNQNNVTLTFAGDVLGTAAYMSPEQARGEGLLADHRSDLYAVGVILFEMVTGERPFRGTIQMVLHQVVHDRVPSPRHLNSAVPADLETIIMKCLEKSPENRYSSADELRDDLLRFLNYEAIHATPPTTMDRFLRWYPSHATQMLGTYFIIAPLTWIFFIIGGLWDAAPSDALKLSSSEFLPWALVWTGVGAYILKNSLWFELVSAALLASFMALPAFIDDSSQSITLICLISFFGIVLHVGSWISRWSRREPAAVKGDLD